MADVVCHLLLSLLARKVLPSDNFTLCGRNVRRDEIRTSDLTADATGERDTTALAELTVRHCDAPLPQHPRH